MKTSSDFLAGLAPDRIPAAEAERLAALSKAVLDGRRTAHSGQWTHPQEVRA